MKKKGFTLLELIITLNILVLFTTITYTSVRAYNNRKINTKINNYTYEIKTILSYGKSYCRKHKALGNIYIDLNENIFKFEVVEKNKEIKKVIYLDKDFSLFTNFSRKSNYISKEGYINEAGTISLKYKEKVVREIKIAVGNDIIGVAEGDSIE